MKTLLIILTTTILFATFGASCVKNAPNCGELPCPTATGANVLSCRINGKAYISKGGKPDLSSFLCKQGNYITSSAFNGPGCVINSYFCNNNNKSEKLTITIDDSLRIGNYILNSTNRADFNGYGYIGRTDDTSFGTLTIIDVTDKFISGKFNFKGLPYGISSFELTEGNFDILR